MKFSVNSGVYSNFWSEWLHVKRATDESGLVAAVMMLSAHAYHCATDVAPVSGAVCCKSLQSKSCKRRPANS